MYCVFHLAFQKSVSPESSGAVEKKVSLEYGLSKVIFFVSLFVCYFPVIVEVIVFDSAVYIFYCFNRHPKPLSLVE